MLAKASRLTKDKDFARVLKRGRQTYGRFYRVKALQNQLAHCRFGISVSTKVSKKAVIRNRLKRQTREVVKNLLAKIKENYDVVIIILQPALGKKYQELADDLTLNFKILKLLK